MGIKVELFSTSTESSRTGRSLWHCAELSPVLTIPFLNSHKALFLNHMKHMVLSTGLLFCDCAVELSN